MKQVEFKVTGEELMHAIDYYKKNGQIAVAKLLELSKDNILNN